MKKIISQLLDKTMAMSAILVSTASLNLPAYASITAANMNVSANITANCSLSNTDLNFGDYDATGINRSRDLLATATISTTCTSGATGVVTMGQGEHVFYCISNNCIRRMANSEETSHLTYQIYTDAGYSVVWNHNTGDMRSVANVTGSGASQGMTVYGKIPKNQINATAGSYSDTIIITLTY